jgi:FLVCR family feline leukemia virus subgroup C receptor-related protein
VTSICCISNTLGIVFGYLCPTFFLNNKMEDQEFKNQIENYLITETIISACLCIPVIIFMKSKPDKPPSNSQYHYQSPPFKECLKMMIKNKSFLKLLISFTCILGYFNVYGTIVNEYFSRYGLDEDQTSYVAVVANVLAIISCLITSIILDKFKNYKKAFIILNLIGFFSHIAMTVLLEILEDNRFIVLTIFWSLCSLSILPIYTLSMDFVCELTYPVGESISGGFIMCFNQISGIIGVK